MTEHSPFNPQRIAILGAQGAIGQAFVQHYAALPHKPHVFACTRKPPDVYCDNITPVKFDITDDASVAEAAQTIAAPLDLVLICTGLLHTDTFGPEKTIKTVHRAHMQHVFNVNTFGPAMVMQHFLPLLPRQQRGILAAISARVGSISDNQIGGWYSYRASKAALNMLVRCAAIEMTRTHPHAVVVGLHPGTVNSPLSQPFQHGLPAGKLFTPAYSAQAMAQVIAQLMPAQSGRLFAYDGQEISP